MSGARIATLAAVAVLGAAGSAVGASVLTLPRAQRVADHVRHREAHNAFGLRQRMGGTFKLGATYCDRTTLRRVLCRYDATGLATDDQGQRMRCGIEIRVRQRAGKVTWARSIAACAMQLWPAP